MTTSAHNYKKDYIRLQGPNFPIRFGESKYIDIIQYLPEYLKESELKEFLKTFEDYLNEMYEGEGGIKLTESEIDVSAIDYDEENFSATSASYRHSVYGEYDVNTTSIEVKTDDVNSIEEEGRYVPRKDRISILEKISRLRDLIDPDLIPIHLIQYYTNNLGYDVGLNRDDVGKYYLTSADIAQFPDEDERKEFEDFQNQVNQNRYLRFMSRNLHEWYRIKTTRNSMQMMLFTFGLIGSFSYYYTTDYRSPRDVEDTILDGEGEIETIAIDTDKLTFKRVFKYLCRSDDPDGNDGDISSAQRLTGVGFENWQLTAPANILKDDVIEDISEISNNDGQGNPFVSTPHFNVVYSIDDSEGNLSSEQDRQKNISEAVMSIKPVNTVFHGIAGYAERKTEKYIYPFMRIRRHIVLRNE